MQYATDVRDAQNDAFESTIGTAPTLEVRSGTMPADCATSDSGTTLLASGALPSDWMANSSGGVKSKSGTWTLTGQSGAGSGAAGTFFRLKVSGTCKAQGTWGAAVSINTSSATSANGNVLNFASTTGVAVGQFITGTGVPLGAKVLAVTSTTVTMSAASTAGVSSGAAIVFAGEMVPDNNSIANGQTITVSAFSITRGNG